MLHLPAPALLQRNVPPEELAQLHSHSRLHLDNNAELILEQQMQRMDYLPELGIRVLQLSASLLNSNEELLKRHPDSIYYACITPELLEAAATEARLVLTQLRSGFHDQDSSAVATELVAVLSSASED